MATTSERLNHDITAFFGYFGTRADNVEQLEGKGPFAPDQHVLIAAGLDALAGYWGRLYAPSIKSGAERMSQFLLTHSNRAIIGKCSGPDAMRRAVAQQKPWASVLATAVGHRPFGGLVRSWRDDPDCDALCGARAVLAAGIDATWLRRSSYGEILYRKYRCAWVHELEGSSDLSYFDDDLSAEPQYQNKVIARPCHPAHVPVPVDQRLILTKRFLMSVYRQAIASFEKACRDDGRSPLPQ